MTGHQSRTKQGTGGVDVRTKQGTGKAGKATSEADCQLQLRMAYPEGMQATCAPS